MIFSNLQKLIRKRGITITKLSQDTKISRTTLTSLLYNQGNGVQYETLEKICYYFNITIEDLFIYIPFNFHVTLFSDTGELAVYTPLDSNKETKRTFNLDIAINKNKGSHDVTVWVSDDDDLRYQHFIHDLSEYQLNTFQEILADKIREEYIEGNFYDDSDNDNIDVTVYLENFDKVSILDIYEKIKEN